MGNDLFSMVFFDGSRAFKYKKGHNFLIDSNRLNVYCWFYCQINTRRAFTPEKFGAEGDQFRYMLTLPSRCVLYVLHVSVRRGPELKIEILVKEDMTP